MKIGKIALAASASIAALGFASPAMAADCEAMTGKSLASGKVDKATLVGAGEYEAPPSPFGAPPGVTGSPYDDLPAFCRLQLTMRPSADSDIKVEVWLPAEGWNGKFVGIGNGIWAGQLSISQLVEPLSRGYATATTDAGHSMGGMSAQFAVGHPEKLKDFGYRAVHEMTVASKQAIEHFYGEAPILSLWNSCSTGGRQGLMSAYRYPEDYDVIAAMSPTTPMTDLMAQTMWTGYFPNRTPESALGRPQLALLEAAVMKECDDDDGLVDGLVSLPESCKFDPGIIECAEGETDGCLNAGQVAIARAVYRGVSDAGGNPILPGWPMGSENQSALVMAAPQPYPVALSYFQLLVHGDDPDWKWQDMDFAREVQAARNHAGHILDVPADGLRAFFNRGGKLLLSDGWSDGFVTANNTVLFYKQLYHALPAQQAQDQLRLFVVPGMGHCGGGTGPSRVDWLATIQEWSDTGQAPNRIVGERVNGGIFFPNAPELPPLKRPICAYPFYARYDGEGDPNAAENFDCVMPE